MRRIIVILIFGLLLASLLYWGYQGQKKETSTASRKISTTIFPLYDIAKHIAGEQIEVVLLLPPGASPHSYEPSPEGIKKLQGSSALFYIGHGIDTWSTDMARSAGIEHQVIVDKNVTLLKMTDEHHHDEEVQGHEEPIDGMDPHYWLNFANAQGIALQIRDELSAQYPEYKTSFHQNYESYQSELQKADRELTDKVQQLPNKNIATFHNAYGYLADNFGLTIVTTFEEFPGEEPTAEYLQEFTTEIQAHKLTAIFAEPQFATRSLQPIAEDLGITISQLDPIGGVDGRDSFISLMNYNVNQVISAVSK